MDATNIGFIMVKIFSYLILFSALSLSIKVSAADIIVATSDAPPYMIEALDAGLDVDITRAALKAVGLGMETRFTTLQKAFLNVKLQQVDAAVPFFSGPAPGLCSSDPHVFYTPAVLTLASSKIKLTNLKQLSQYRLATFQGAKQYFPKAFGDAVDRSPVFYQHSDMKALVALLLRGDVDVVVLDYNIFHYHLGLLRQEPYYQEVENHSLLPAVTASVVFNDKELCQRFNRGLALIKSNGEYRRILNNYRLFGVSEKHPIP